MLKICKKCNKEFRERKGYINYCSNICLYSRQASKKGSNNKKIALHNYHSKKRIEKEIVNKEAYKKSIKGKCIECNKDLPYEFRNRKTCSDICYSEYRSKNRLKNIIKNGTTNFSTKVSNFNYKGIDYKCDSKLEIAGIIFLLEIEKVNKIERFNNILFFNDENNNKKRFNPDFIAKKDNKTFIIEVKMQWSKTSEHKYNKYIPNKKEALINYCNKNGYNMIWLDFDYNKQFRSIYKKVLSNKY